MDKLLSVIFMGWGSTFSFTKFFTIKFSNKAIS